MSDHDHPQRKSWGMSYEDWERSALPATTETVREAMAYERMGWPMPVSGTLTLLASAPCYE